MPSPEKSTRRAGAAKESLTDSGIFTETIPAWAITFSGLMNAPAAAAAATPPRKALREGPVLLLRSGFFVIFSTSFRIDNPPRSLASPSESKQMIAAIELLYQASVKDCL
jgi:hypothetical protein